MLIAIFCLIFLLRLPPPKDAFQKYWSLFIAMIGLGALGGALVHGFPTVLGQELFYWMWALKNVFIPVGNYFASFLMLKTLFPQKMKSIKPLLIAKMIIINVIMFISYSFLPIVIDIAITYILVIALSGKLIPQVKAYKPIRFSFLIAFFSGFLYVFKIDIDEVWFSHKDLIHVFVIISIYFIYKAINIRNQDYVFGKIL